MLLQTSSAVSSLVFLTSTFQFSGADVGEFSFIQSGFLLRDHLGKKKLAAAARRQREESRNKLKTFASKDLNIDSKVMIFSHFFIGGLEGYYEIYRDKSSCRVCETSALSLDQLCEDLADICTLDVIDNLNNLDNCWDFYLFADVIDPTLFRLKRQMISTFKAGRISMTEDKTSIILDFIAMMSEYETKTFEINQNTNNLYVSKLGTFGNAGRFLFQYCVDSLGTLFGQPSSQLTSRNSDELPAAEDVV